MSYTDTPSRFEPDADRSQRIRRGIALCRTVLDGITATREITVPDPDVSPAVRAARQRAAEERRTYRPIGNLKDTLGPLRTAMNRRAGR